MPVLVDTSIWIDYFRNAAHEEALDFLIDEDLLVANDLILTELVPWLMLRNQRKSADGLRSVRRLHLQINWEQLIGC